MFGPRVSKITIDEFARRIREGDPVVVDVREPDEYASGHVPGSLNIPVGTLPASAAALDPSAETLLICRSGHRSITAAKRLMRAGFTDVHSVTGGTLAWRGPLER